LIKQPQLYAHCDHFSSSVTIKATVTPLQITPTTTLGGQCDNTYIK